MGIFIDININIESENNDLTTESNIYNQNNCSMTPCIPLNNLDDISWAQIAEIADKGKAREYFALGATKTDYMRYGYYITYRIIGFDHDDLADDTGKAPISWEAIHISYEDKAMNNKEDSSSDGKFWDNSCLRDYLNNDFKNNVSDGLAKIVKKVWKPYVGREGKIAKSADEFWIISEQELYRRCFNSYAREGRWYDFYKQENVEYFKRSYTGQNKYWLRSICYDKPGICCCVDANGGSQTNFLHNVEGFAPEFCC